MSDHDVYSARAGVLLIGKLLATLFDFLTPLIIVRVLGKYDVGVLTALFLVYSTLALVFMAGMPATLMYFLPSRADGERRAIAWKVATGMSALGGLTSVLMALMAAGLYLFPDAMSQFTSGGDPGSMLKPSEMAGLLLLMSLYPLVDLPVRMLPNLLVVEGRAHAAAGVGVFKAIGSSCALLIPLATGMSLAVTLTSIIVFGALYTGVLVYYLYALYPTRGTADDVTLKTLFAFAIPVGMTDIVGKLNSSFDKWLIIGLFAAVAFAEYQAGAWQVPLLVTVAYTVGEAYTPRFAELFKQGKPREAIAIWRTATLKVALPIIPLTLVFVVGAEETMELLFTADYVRGANVFRLYCLLTLGRVAAYGAVIVAAGRPKLILKVALASLVANVVISVPLTLWIGFEGPALGTLIAFVFTVYFYCWGIGQAAGMPTREIFPFIGWLKTVLLGVVASAPAMAFKFGVEAHAGLKLIGITLILLATYSVIATMTGMISRNDWRYLTDWLRGRVFRSA